MVLVSSVIALFLLKHLHIRDTAWFLCEYPNLSLRHPSLLVGSVVAQDVGGTGPGLVSHAAEQYGMFPTPRPQPSTPAQTLPHCQPHRLRLRHRGAGSQLPLSEASRHSG